jgi:DNA mismatch repair protein MutS2
MNEKTLKVLEYDKIINKLVSFTTSQLGKEKAEELLPVRDIETIRDMLRETVLQVVSKAIFSFG